jgi:type I restriction-modification system DNA methylase subunit
LDDLLKYGLEKLEMIDGNGQSIGLVPVLKPDQIDFAKYTSEEIIAIENAYSYGAHYIYFRRFKNRPPVPQVYIYNFTTTAHQNEKDLISLHQRLYSSGHVPMFFVFTNKDIRIFNCYDKPAKGNTLIYKPLTIIKTAVEISNLFNEQDVRESEKFRAFSGKAFDNGSFWEDSSFSKEFQFSNSAYEKLLTELKQALKDIIYKKILPTSIARKIMVISILIKYLEERADENNNSVFPKAGETRVSVVNGKRTKIQYDKNFFERFSKGATSFTDVLKKQGAGLKLLTYLADHFNGGVFNLSDKEKKSLEKVDLTRFALFLEGKLEGVQFVFWRLYSFNDLPVELISNIYEEFLEKKPGVVYTPPYLVNFLLDEAMPLRNEDTEFKVLDPACGSGVFLVGAFRRLIYRWRKKNNWKKPKLSILKKLLIENIYGSDKDIEAVNLTVFSLSLALCDELTPLEIWENLEFDDLSKENIFSDDFFNLIIEKKFVTGYFDLVIGNPPFEAKLTPAAAQIEAQSGPKRTVRSLDSRILNNSLKLPDNQIALLFLEQSVPLCKSGKLVCLIQPSGPLLYNNLSFQFRKHLLEKNNVPQIIDFTHISRVLFGKNGDVGTAAIFIKNDKPTNKGILHLTVRRTKPNKEKIYFELDTYDFHYIPRKLALIDPLIWKSNLLTGSRTHQIISRLSEMSTLGKYLSKKTDDGWVSNQGFIPATKEDLKLLAGLKKESKKNSIKKEEYQKILKKLTSAKITGKAFLPTDAFTEKGIQTNRIDKALSLKYFHRKGDPKAYEPPHILIKEIAGEESIPIEFRNDYLTFKNEIIGIHAPNKDKRALQDLFDQFQQYQELYLFYLAGASGRYMVNKATSLLKEDIMNLPFPNKTDRKLLELNDYERIVVDDVLKYLLEFRRAGEKSVIAVTDASKDDLSNFGKIFCDVLNSVYSTLKCYTPFETDSYICYPFYFKDKPEIQFDDKLEAERQIEALVRKISGVSLRITRIVRLYEKNVIYIIKPKKLRYWLGSIALRDADETFSDLRKQGF